MARPYPSSLPTPHSRPPQTLSSLASLLFTNTHKCVNTEPQPHSFPSFVNTPNKAVLSLERRPKRSTKQFLLVVFDMEIFKIAANKQWSITSTGCQIFSWRTAPLFSPHYLAPSAYRFNQSVRKWEAFNSLENKDTHTLSTPPLPSLFLSFSLLPSFQYPPWWPR